MILIISTYDDRSTWDVVAWLQYYKVKHIVLTPQDFISKVSLEGMGGFSLKIEKIIVSSKNIKSFWYRRGNLNLYNIPKKSMNNDKKDEVIRSFAKQESQILEHYIYIGSLKKVPLILGLISMLL